MSPLLEQVLVQLAQLSPEEQLEVIAFTTKQLQGRSHHPSNSGLAIAAGVRSGEPMSAEAIAAELATDLVTTTLPTQEPDDHDPLMGLFSGSPTLATQAEEILQQDALAHSGWSWKQ